MAKTFKNTKFTKRDYECTNIVACVSEVAPATHWQEADDTILNGLTKLYTNIQNGAETTYYGFL